MCPSSDRCGLAGGRKSGFTEEEEADWFFPGREAGESLQEEGDAFLGSRLRLFLLASDAPLSAALVPQLQAQSMRFPSKLTAPDQPGDHLTQSS